MAKAKEEKPKADNIKERISDLRAKLEKDFGKGAIMGAKDKPIDHDSIPSGSIGLDAALGIGGYAKGRIVEIFGWESSGKTTLAIHAMAEAQKKSEKFCAIVDAEHAFDTKYAQNLGVDLERLQINQPMSGEEGLEIAYRLCDSGDFSVVVVDSVAALTPKSEVEGDIGDPGMGKHARLMSAAMRKLTAAVAKSGTVLIFINQVREKIGVMFGSPDTTTGGNALKFYASQRLQVTRSIAKDNKVMNGDTVIGNLIKVKVIKNKVAPPFVECEFDVIYGEGLDKMGEIIDLAVTTKIVSKSGAFFKYGETTLGQGRDAVKDLLRDNTELADELTEKIKKSYVAVPAEEKVEA